MNKIHNMVSRVLQLTILTVFATVLTLTYIFWQQSPALALSFSLGSLLFYISFFGLQFLFLNRLNSKDATKPAGRRELLAAWWGEILQIPRIFLWRQAFFWNAIPDTSANTFDFQGRRGVVFIHGFICNRGLWTPWLEYLKKNRRAFVAVTLEPVFGSIDAYASLIDDAVSRVTIATGMRPLIVCHSMGGLAVRAWLRAEIGAESRVHHVVTIGTPHNGTGLARLAFTPNGRQMRLNSDWLRQLQVDEPKTRHNLFTCYYSNCDNVVFPASIAKLQNADNRFVAGTAHLAMAVDQTVMSESLARI